MHIYEVNEDNGPGNLLMKFAMHCDECGKLRQDTSETRRTECQKLNSHLGGQLGGWPGGRAGSQIASQIGSHSGGLISG